jgi:acetylornithine deacetylase/succinyl-diaminopimelate desuccinylase-like protein
MSEKPISALEIARALIAFPSVTPADAGALPYVKTLLAEAGFAAEIVTFAAPGKRRTSSSPATPTWSPRATSRAGASIRSPGRSPTAGYGAAAPAT